MVDAMLKIDENRDLEDRHGVIKDTAAIVFLGGTPLLRWRVVL